MHFALRRQLQVCFVLLPLALPLPLHSFGALSPGNSLDDLPVNVLSGQVSQRHTSLDGFLRILLRGEISEHPLPFEITMAVSLNGPHEASHE